MIHLVFQQADVAVLKKAIELDVNLQGEVFEIKDEFAVGPLKHLNTEEGWEARLEWWRTLLKHTPYNSELVGSFDDRKTVQTIRERLTETPDEPLWIWMGQNGHDVCGYFWLINELASLQGRVNILFMNNLPFINEKGGLFYPSNLHEILPKEFIKAKKLSRTITASEWETDVEEWNRLAAENSMVRILEGGKKITDKGEDFYDTDILGALTEESQKGNRAMHHILSKMKIKTGDVFLLHRMIQLAQNGQLELNGDPTKGWKEFDVKLVTQKLQMEQPNQT